MTIPPYRNRWTRAAAALALLSMLAAPLRAHAILLEAAPAKNATLSGPDVAIRLRFNSRIDGARSQISLLLPDRRVQALKLDKQAAPEILASSARGLGPGAYRLRWQVLASDGHITRGEYPFAVK
jgi:methionine-rich copper-binding protein CopC